MVIIVAAIINLYTAKTAKLPFSKYFSKYLIAMKPKKAAASTATKKEVLKISEDMSLNSNRNAPTMAGVPSKKENLAESFLFNPIALPAIIVIPERETPGISAIDWAMPTKKVFPKVERSIINRD